MTQSELESRIQVLLAGTIAEEMVFADISTGAQNDLERATEIARSMVMEFGMSRLGRVTYRESTRSDFLAAGAETHRERHHSEATAREIDQEIRRIIDESLVKVRHILETRHKALEALAQCLIEKEVVDTDELKQIIEANCPNPVIVPGTAPATRKPLPGRIETSSADGVPPKAEEGAG
jgi:cell division protease FtsH